MALLDGDVVDISLRGFKVGGRTYSNTWHYRIEIMGSGPPLTTLEVGEVFRDLWRSGDGADPGLGSYFIPTTVLGGLYSRRVIGAGPDPGGNGAFSYDQQVFVPIGFQPGPGIPPEPSGVALRIEKLTGEPERYFQGRVHHGSLAEDFTGPDGDAIVPATLTAMTVAAAMLVTIPPPSAVTTWRARMVVLSRTHWIRFGGPIAEHYRDVTAFTPRGKTGTMRRRTPPA